MHLGNRFTFPTREFDRCQRQISQTVERFFRFTSTLLFPGPFTLLHFHHSSAASNKKWIRFLYFYDKSFGLMISFVCASILSWHMTTKEFICHWQNWCCFSSKDVTADEKIVWDEYLEDLERSNDQTEADSKSPIDIFRTKGSYLGEQAVCSSFSSGCYPVSRAAAIARTSLIVLREQRFVSRWWCLCSRQHLQSPSQSFQNVEQLLTL